MSHDRIENLPFTTYDLVGYLGPGCVVTLFPILFLGLGNDQLMAALSSGNFTIQVLALLTLLIVAYIAGHMVSYASSEISEKFIVRTLGYPSTYLMMGKVRPDKETARKSAVGHKILKNVTSQLIGNGFGLNGPWFTRFIFVFHIVLLVPILLSMISSFGFYTEPLSPCTVKECKKRFIKQWPKHKKALKKFNENWFELLAAYTLNKYPYVAPKAYNYVVLYGILRSMFFIFTLLSWGLLVQSVCDIGLTKVTAMARGTLSGFIFAQVGAWLLGMAYCKFYRRYSREIITTFAAAPT